MWSYQTLLPTYKFVYSYFLPVIQLAGQRSPNCLTSLKSCKNSMPFSSRLPDPLPRKAPKRSPRQPWSYFFCHCGCGWCLMIFLHIFYQSSWSRWAGTQHKQLVLELREVGITKLLIVNWVSHLFFFSSGILKFLQLIGGVVCLESCQSDRLPPALYFSMLMFAPLFKSCTDGSEKKGKKFIWLHRLEMNHKVIVLLCF